MRNRILSEEPLDGTVFSPDHRDVLVTTVEYRGTAGRGAYLARVYVERCHATSSARPSSTDMHAFRVLQRGTRFSQKTLATISLSLAEAYGLMEEVNGSTA